MYHAELEAEWNTVDVEKKIDDLSLRLGKHQGQSLAALAAIQENTDHIRTSVEKLEASQRGHSKELNAHDTRLALIEAESKKKAASFGYGITFLIATVSAIVGAVASALTTKFGGK